MFDAKALVGNYVALIPTVMSELDCALKSQQPDEIRQGILRARELLERLHDLSSAAMADLVLARR
ncbi:hypothetical protein [Rhodoplanes sp. Z2-YC6860]|uniref:hypothetical protein n=1 Tax=Rhodoplanes sp. Z2-YC6860 TaxID=674703 RepID=UPI00082E5D0B|nr:hypothetical protein [Rhodoplanes sp. Z2-YC6860]